MIYNVAIIGYGYWGPKLARNFHNSNNFNIKYIVDTSKKNLVKAKTDFPLSKLLLNYRLINNKKIDLAVIATPTKSHFKICNFFFVSLYSCVISICNKHRIIKNGISSRSIIIKNIIIIFKW